MAEDDCKSGARWALVAGVVVAVLCGYWRYSFLMSSPHPLGVDGYYYAIQVRSLLAGDGLYYPASPVAFWLMALPSWLSDPVTGAKIVAAFVPTAIAIPLVGIGLRMAVKPAIALVVATFYVTSQSSLFLSAEFVKTGIALTFAALTWWAALAGAEHRRWFAVSLLLVIVVALTHKLGFAIALWGAAAIWFRGAVSRRVWIAALVSVCVLLVPGLIWPARFPGPRDFSLLTALWSTTPQFSLPALAHESSVVAFGHDGWLTAFAAVAGALALRFAVPMKERRLIGAMTVLCAVISIPWLNIEDAEALGFRLRCVSLFPAAIVLGAVASGMSGTVPANIRVAMASAVVLALLVFKPHAPQSGVVWAHPPILRAVQNASAHLRAGDVIITPDRQIMFMATWVTGFPARRDPTPVSAEHRAWLMPLPYISPRLAIAIADLRRMPVAGVPAPISLDSRRKNGLLLMRDATWQYLQRRPSKATGG